ncbi:MAG: carbon storage regulator [Planctomycetia bacterium]|nr:carbon storage regulator [Planctomycetia bacterium]
MLVLSRREGESIRLGDDILVTVVRIAGNKIRIGIETKAGLSVLRSELLTNGEQEKSILEFELPAEQVESRKAG